MVEARTFYEFLEEYHYRDTRRYSYLNIIKTLDLKERTFNRHKSDAIRGKRFDEPVTPEMIRALAELFGVTRREVMEALGFGDFYDEKPRFNEINAFSQLVFPRKNRAIDEAYDSGIQGRAAHLVGNFEQALRDFNSGVKSALSGNDPLLAAYLLLFCGNTLRMMARFDEAQVQLTEAKKLCEQFIKDSQSASQQPLQAHAEKKSVGDIATNGFGRRQKVQRFLTAQMLAVRAEAFLIISSWSLGDLERVLRKAPDVIALMEDATKDFTFLPNMYYFLGRTLWNIRRFDDALYYASKGLDDAYALEASRRAGRALFLDYPVQSDFHRRVLLLVQLLADIQIVQDKCENAAETLLSFGIQASPATLWSTHAYFSLQWQEYIKDQPALQWGDFDEWREAIRETKNIHALLINQYHHARTLHFCKDLDGAAALLEEAFARAQEVQLTFTAAECGIELVHICAERQRRNDKQLAMQTLNMVQGIVNRFGVRFLRQEYERAREVAESIK